MPFFFTYAVVRGLSHDEVLCPLRAIALRGKGATAMLRDAVGNIGHGRVHSDAGMQCMY